MADGAGTAGSVIKGISPMLNAVPYFGPILSMAGTMVGGALEMGAANKQQEQAKREREEALKMQAKAVDPLFQQKLRADKAAELAGLPGKALWQQMLDQRTATDLRAIQESSPSGAATLAAISAAEGNKNQALNELMMNDAQFRANMGENTRKTLWDVGLQKNRQEDIMLDKQANQLQAASALEAAGTYNKQGGINKIIGAGTSTLNALTSNAQQKEKDDAWMKFLQEYYLGQNRTTQAPVGSVATMGSTSISSTPANTFPSSNPLDYLNFSTTGF